MTNEPTEEQIIEGIARGVERYLIRCEAWLVMESVILRGIEQGVKNWMDENKSILLDVYFDAARKGQ